MCFSKNSAAAFSNFGCPAVNVYYRFSVNASSAIDYLTNYGGGKLGNPCPKFSHLF